jgi:hypothetical protein
MLHQRRLCATPGSNPFLSLLKIRGNPGRIGTVTRVGRSALRKAAFVFTGFVAVLTVSAAPKSTPSLDTGTEAIKSVFARYPKDKKEIWPISGYARHTPVRPLQQSTFASLQKYFSQKQQRNVDEFLRALSSLIDTRDRLARALGIYAKWWWPTGIDSLQVDGVLSRDLLTDRSDNPDQMTISKPKILDGKLEFIVKEVFTEVGQDRILGKGKKTSIVELIPESGRWVIDEVTSSTTDAYGATRVDTLTQLLHDATQTFRRTENAIKKLPQELEVRKGQALRQSSQHDP